MIKRPWFKAKLYGWGWYPSTWEGWTIMILWFAAIIEIFKLADINSHSASDTLIKMALPFLFLLLLLLIITWKTGEKPRWRWGK